MRGRDMQDALESDIELDLQLGHLGHFGRILSSEIKQRNNNKNGEGRGSCEAGGVGSGDLAERQRDRQRDRKRQKESGRTERRQTENLSSLSLSLVSLADQISSALPRCERIGFLVFLLKVSFTNSLPRLRERKARRRIRAAQSKDEEW